MSPYAPALRAAPRAVLRTTAGTGLRTAAAPVATRGAAPASPTGDAAHGPRPIPTPSAPSVTGPGTTNRAEAA